MEIQACADFNEDWRTEQHQVHRCEQQQEGLRHDFLLLAICTRHAPTWLKMQVAVTTSGVRDG
uniref:Uncharacterized protein n=3 Tax=Oryza sativa subsp. japonica TaxID=39947 RepID=Q67V85_ORYSJ|nr:hypothetical protein [Oryza sativa Japonica Group]